MIEIPPFINIYLPNKFHRIFWATLPREDWIIRRPRATLKNERFFLLTSERIFYWQTPKQLYLSLFYYTVSDRIPNNHHCCMFPIEAALEDPTAYAPILATGITLFLLNHYLKPVEPGVVP